MRRKLSSEEIESRRQERERAEEAGGKEFLEGLQRWLLKQEQVSLDMVMPNGKKLKDCTFGYCKKIGAAINVIVLWNEQTLAKIR